MDWGDAAEADDMGESREFRPHHAAAMHRDTDAGVEDDEALSVNSAGATGLAAVFHPDLMPLAQSQGRLDQKTARAWLGQVETFIQEVLQFERVVNHRDIHRSFADEAPVEEKPSGGGVHAEHSAMTGTSYQDWNEETGSDRLSIDDMTDG